MTYVSMLDRDGIVRVRQPDNRYDERGWNTEDVLTERWLQVDEMRADAVRTVAQMQAEMDAIEVQLEEVLTGNPASAALIPFHGRVVRCHPARI
jgi:hypothetical protein